MTPVIVLILRWYKAGVSPFLPPACRFYPTCSDYGVQAVEKYGPVRGLWLALKRLMRCHPLRAGGLDLVP